MKIRVTDTPPHDLPYGGSVCVELGARVVRMSWEDAEQLRGVLEDYLEVP